MSNGLPAPSAAGDANDAFPTQARVVVIGGGIVGARVAYHLTERGWRDVVLLERNRLTSGTTGHANGRYEVEVATERFPAGASFPAPYDPTNAPIRS